MMTAQTVHEKKASGTISSVMSGYASDDLPLRAYLGLIGTYSLGFLGLSFVLNNYRPQRRDTVSEFALMTLARYKLSRIVTMSFIASPLRSPFTHRGVSLSGGEVQDEARGSGLQKAIGNLLTCPFCFNIWAGTFLVALHEFSPRTTIRLCKILSVGACADVLDHYYRQLRQLSA